MKRNIAIVGSILLVLSILVFFAGCDMPGGVILDREQQIFYSAFIVEIAREAQDDTLSPAYIKSKLEETNKNYKPLEFKIVDKTPDDAIAKGSTTKELKKRFVPKKL